MDRREAPRFKFLIAMESSLSIFLGVGAKVQSVFPVKFQNRCTGPFAS
jgi:hypothetical protein